MKFLGILSILLINFSICSNNDDLLMIKFIQNRFVSILNSSYLEVKDEACRTVLNEIYLQNNDTLTPFSYLYKYSSHSKNDIGSYRQCSSLINPSNLPEYNFFLLIILPTLQNNETNVVTSKLDFKGDYLLGACVKSGCDSDSLIELLYQFDKKTNNTFGFYNKDNNNLTTSIKVIDIYKNNQNLQNDFKNPWIICFMIMISFYLVAFLFLNNLPNSCKKQKKKKKEKKIMELQFKNELSGEFTLSDTDTSMEEYNKEALHEISSCFDITKNFEDFFTNKRQTTQINYSGLGYVYELRCIMILLTLIGFTYMSIINSRLIIYQESKYKEMISSYFFALIVFCIRYAPRILFSCSGYMLVYKLFCYLDEKLQKLQKKEPIQEPHSILDSNLSDFVLKEHEQNQEDSKFSWLIRFLFSQFHKYYIAFITFLFYKYLFFVIMRMFGSVKSTIIYLKEELVNTVPFLDIVGHFLLYQSFNVTEAQGQIHTQDSCILPIFWLFFNEIVFFILTTPLIFICYKKKLKITIVFLGLFVVFITIRFVLYYCYFDPKSTFATDFLKGQQNTYGLFFIFPLYNYSYFIIGVIFGLINYSIQKGISANDVEEGDKGYLRTVVFLAERLKDLKRCGKAIIIIILLIIILGISFFMQIFLNFSLIEYFHKNAFVNAFYLIDIDIGIFIIHILYLIYYTSGSQFFGHLFMGKFWNILNNSYFNFILNGKFSVYFIIFQTETLWSLETSTILIIASLSSILIFVVGILFTLIIELPFKNLFRYIVFLIRKRSKKVKQK